MFLILVYYLLYGDNLVGDCAKLIIYSGRVQGVGFRFTAQRIAARYLLSGYVRNLPDGGVELFVQGGLDDVNECMMDIAETFGANIRDVRVTEAQRNPNYDSFNITY